MRGGGGTKASTSTFKPKEGMLYRIINYATIPFNSGTTINGAPKYLICNSDGSLGTTTDFTWDNRNLLWTITPVDGGFQIRNYGTGLYFTPTNVTTAAGGDQRIGTTTKPAVFTINYVGNQSPSQSGLTTSVSMYRINSPAASNQQIRARHFENDWIWGSGTFDRADMIFTFAEIEEVRINPVADGLLERSPLVTTKGERANAEWFDLSGKRLVKQPSQQGIFIMNGKKWAR